MGTPQEIDRIERIVREEKRRLRDRIASQRAADEGGPGVRLAELFSTAFGQPSADADARKL